MKNPVSKPILFRRWLAAGLLAGCLSGAELTAQPPVEAGTGEEQAVSGLNAQDGTGGAAAVGAMAGVAEADQAGLVEEAVPGPVAPPAPPLPSRPFFGGSWEKDFGRSDRWEDELNRQLDQLRRDAERGYQLETRRGPAISLGSGRRGRSGANIVELAQLTGFINRQTTLRIQQSAVEIRIERKDDADLVCSTEQAVSYTWDDVAGEEVCGWDGPQLLFSVTLPEGVQILHRFSLSDDGQWLNMATTTSSAAASFTQIQFFYRYDSPSENYTCIQTISRGNTCSLRDSVQYE
ncbi:MAG: hypothetical protein R3F41_08135 [Gammaproteobacteria bacterium]|nr:hypothetical protein [Pseudomonadales bacterium]MCP5347096.1 hypothetical protein [Pseudomonadales bacterium]